MKNPQLHSIQALRGFAALLVVLLHAAGGVGEYFNNDLFDRFFAFGHCGVDIFFVISGFLMMWVHKKDIDTPTQWLYFLKRRFARIYPTYWVAFLFPFCLYLFQGRIGEGAEITPISAMKSFFLLPQEGRPVLVVSWTLVYEIIFYLIFGFLILNKRLGIFCFTFWLVGISVCALGNFPSASADPFFDLRNLEFFLGIGIAFLLQKYPSYASPWCWKISLALFGCGIFVNWYYPNSFYWLATLPTALFLLGLVNFNLENRIPQAMLSLGKISYSLYLIHVPIILLLCKCLPMIMNSSWIAFSVLLLCSLSGGYIFYHFIEKPMVNIFNKLRFKTYPFSLIY